MTVKVNGFKAERQQPIIAALGVIGFEDLEIGQVGADTTGLQISSTTVLNLCAGETEDEFADRVSKDVWVANAGYCQVEVAEMYLDDQPQNTFFPDQDSFARLCPELDKARDG